MTGSDPITDPVHDLLQDAGRRWRATQPLPPEPDPSRWEPGRRPAADRSHPSRRPRAAVLGVAAGTLLAVGLGSVVAGRITGSASAPGREGGGQVSVVVTPAASGSSGSRAMADLVVRDGDVVQASGTVLAAPGKPVRFCSPAPVPAWGGGTRDLGIPDCSFGVPVAGVDLTRLTQARQAAGFRFGSARLRGVWRAGTLRVTEQGPPDQQSHASSASEPSPCPPPAGGWATAGPADNKALFAYVEEEHPDRFRRPWVTYPYPHPQGTGPGVTPAPGSEVLVVELVKGDVEAEQRELRRRYGGNLCVVSRPGTPSLADQAAIAARLSAGLDPLMRDPGNGIYAAAAGEAPFVELVVLTPQLRDRIAAIGPGPLEVRPWLRPVR